MNKTRSGVRHNTQKAWKVMKISLYQPLLILQLYTTNEKGCTTRKNTA
jgi:hypothetical protein